MPSIWARMSGSSSTISISCAMLRAPHPVIRRFGLSPGLVAPLGRRLPPREGQHRARAAALRGIFEAELSPVVLHDLLHDGKAEAGALRLVRDIGLGEPVAL